MIGKVKSDFFCVLPVKTTQFSQVLQKTLFFNKIHHQVVDDAEIDTARHRLQTS